MCATLRIQTKASPSRINFQSANRKAVFMIHLCTKCSLKLFIYCYLKLWKLTGNCNPCSKTSCACGDGSRVSGPIQPVTMSYTITHPKEWASIETFPCQPGCRLANIKYNLFSSFCKPALTSAPYKGLV